MTTVADFASLLSRALIRRHALIESGVTDACRLFAGKSEGAPGVYLDRYGPGAVLILHETDSDPGTDPEASPTGLAASPRDLAHAALETLRPQGVRAVYLKVFPKDRSQLGGVQPAFLTDPAPAAGEPLPNLIPIREHAWKLGVRLYDGYSTGLFMDQRDNRKRLAELATEGRALRVLNTFAYTCAFSVACAAAGAQTTSVDVSARYLQWGKDNFALNAIDPQPHRFARMDTIEFFDYARRKQLRYDLVILDPPSFAAGKKSRGVRTFSAVRDYPELLRRAAELLDPGGVIFASTNTRELCIPGRFDRMIDTALGSRPRRLTLPPPAPDFAPEPGRFIARLFQP